MRKKADADAQATVCAELHDHAGEQHGSGGRRGHVAGGRPGVEGPHAGENPEADEDQRETPHLEADRQARVRKIAERGGVRTRGHISGEQSDEHHGRADEGVERQLHGAVLAARGAPDGDEEILGNDGDFVKDEEQEKVAAQKHAVDAADEREIKSEELIGAQVDVPTKENARDRGDAGEQDQHAADAVSREQEVDAHRRHPEHVDKHLSPLPKSRRVARNGETQSSHGHGEREPPRKDGFVLGQQRRNERAGERNSR